MKRPVGFRPFSRRSGEQTEQLEQPLGQRDLSLLSIFERNFGKKRLEIRFRKAEPADHRQHQSLNFLL